MFVGSRSHWRQCQGKHANCFKSPLSFSSMTVIVSLINFTKDLWSYKHVFVNCQFLGFLDRLHSHALYCENKSILLRLQRPSGSVIQTYRQSWYIFGALLFLPHSVYLVCWLGLSFSFRLSRFYWTGIWKSAASSKRESCVCNPSCGCLSCLPS